MFYRGMGPGHFGAQAFGGGGLMLLMMGFRLVVLIVLIIVGIKLYKKYKNNPSNNPSNNSSDVLKILDERFAKGEIDEEEYLKKKAILTQKN